jgi:uncharacterized protein involved in type VI secretion and phage assembly
VGIQGLHAGLVTEVEDPAGAYRVRVSVPSLGTGESVWARIACFYASNAVGAVFCPEVGDEVVLGFMNDDPRNPIILGSLYGPTHPPTYPPDKENRKKAIVTRAKLEMTYDDTDRIIEIKTPGGHSIQLNDKTGEIKIRDSNSNSVTLAGHGIMIDSASQIEMKAKTNISIKAGGNLDMEATGHSSLQAAQISEHASAGHSVIADGTAKLTAIGPLTINGALVKIN